MLGDVGSRIVLLAWIPLVAPFFMLLPARRAMVVATIAGWLLLPPVVQIALPGIPDFGKTTAVMFGLLFGTIVFEPNRLFSFRPRWFDLPMIVFSVCPFFSALSNDQTAYDGLSASFIHFMNWLVPYWLGRVYLTDVESFRELGLGIIIGGLCLTPFCLVETKYTQIFLKLFYGVARRGLFDGGRYGGFRPSVFFACGLECGLWMSSVQTTVGDSQRRDLRYFVGRRFFVQIRRCDRVARHRLCRALVFHAVQSEVGDVVPAVHRPSFLCSAHHEPLVGRVRRRSHQHGIGP
jgi:hypothetical protein